MFCIKCGKQLDDNALFCKYCGEKVNQDNNINIEDRKTREVIYDGELHKCPNCGELLKSFTPNCPSCGYELRWTKNGTNKVQEFLELLKNTNSIARKKELISNFYVPNTKEDLIEFFTLAISQIDDDSPCAEAWFSKLDQTLIKAKMTFGDTEDYQYLKQLYDKAKKTKRLTDNKNQFSGIIGIIMPAFVALLGIIFLIIGIFISRTLGSDERIAGIVLIIFGSIILAIAFFVFIFFFFGLRNKNKNKYKDVYNEEDR